MNRLMCLSLALFQLGCSTRTTIQRIGNHESSGKHCEVVFLEKQSEPQGSEVVGKIESHIKRNVFFGGQVQLQDEAYAELRRKACLLGGDAVVIDDHIESSAAEMSHVHVWATVLKTK